MQVGMSAAMASAGANEFLAEASRLISTRDAAGARAVLERGAHEHPQNAQLRMQLALSCRMLGDHQAAIVALDAALAIDPYDFLALLSKGAVIEQLGDLRAAAEVYRHALKLTPTTPHPSLGAPIERARRVVAEDATALEQHLSTAVADLRAQHTAEELERFDECLDIFVGKTKPYVPEPALLLFPRLPPLPFYDAALFPWMPALEAKTDVIRAEAERVMREDWGAFHPYIQKTPGSPVNQWQELNHNPAWSSLHLWRDGAKIDANCVRCPETTAILENLPMADQPGYAPTAMFSVLAPHTHIPPHTGSANTRIIVHLPLILPDKCRYRVGNEHRQWRMGKAWAFDDTIEHEAWNDSDEVRVLLIFDIWNPFLTEAERKLVSAMMTARQTYRRA
jgi:aspartyl/asparaginyl beta-hydroxylase (cupin superfamily)